MKSPPQSPDMKALQNVRKIIGEKAQNRNSQNIEDLRGFLSRQRKEAEGHCWRSKDELISDVLLWTPAYGQVKAGRPVRTYIQQLCEDTRCSPEDLPEAMNDREKWRERVRYMRASGTTWWWWWWWWWGFLKEEWESITTTFCKMVIGSYCQRCYKVIQ